MGEKREGCRGSKSPAMATSFAKVANIGGQVAEARRLKQTPSEVDELLVALRQANGVSR